MHQFQSKSLIFNEELYNFSKRINFIVLFNHFVSPNLLILCVSMTFFLKIKFSLFWLLFDATFACHICQVNVRPFNG